MHQVVVTGLGFVTCLGISKAAVLDSLLHLRHGICRYPPFDSPDIPVKVAAPIPGFETESADPEDWTYPQELKIRLEILRGLAPQGLYAMHAFQQAVDDARLPADLVSHPRTGLYTASAGSASRTFTHMERMKRVGPQRCSPLGIIGSIAGTLTFNLVAFHKIKGSSVGFVSACASSGHALGAACDEIALGRQDRMIVVGAEDFCTDTILPFLSMRVLSTCPNPDLASRPFDSQRDGFVGTGGAVALILENADAARARQAPVYARLEGWGQASDGYHVAASHPDGDGLARAMTLALQATGHKPEEVDYINAHATSTPLGDVSELRAIKRVFGQHAGTLAVSSTKALTGHALSLSSILEASFVALAMRENFTPGSAHIQNLDPEATGVRIIRENLPNRPRLALSNSSGFGGANVVLVFSHAG